MSLFADRWAFSLTKLQRGRVVSNAECDEQIERRVNITVPRSASTGPRCFQRGMKSCPTMLAAPRHFNGAALFPTRNVPMLSASRGIVGRASTGPRCFQRGMMRISKPRKPRRTPLQRGRVVSNAEWPGCNCIGPCEQASTGPRCFQRGMAASRRPTPAALPRFNGAALFPTRNVIQPVPPLSALAVLQRGRVVSNAE